MTGSPHASPAEARSRLTPSNRWWQAWWRTFVDVPGRASPYAIRRLRSRDAAEIRARVAVEAADAFAGEIRLTAPDGTTVWTDLVRVAAWDCVGRPEETRSGLWREEERHRRLVGYFIAAVDRAVALGVGTTVLLPHDADGIVAYAENAVRLARMPAALRATG